MIILEILKNLAGQAMQLPNSLANINQKEIPSPGHRIMFTPTSLGSIEIKNRLVMAPLTRMRAISDSVPSTLAAEYYGQRASAGLIITEATQISPLGAGYPATPGIYSSRQAEAWSDIVSKVHAKQGTIVAQLWHVGRISHSSHHMQEGLSIAPSSIAATGQIYGADWRLYNYENPREMTWDDISIVLNEYKLAAQNARACGFDGIEIHAANGYLLDQFLQDKTNQRKDHYGGTIENRLRLLGEVIAECSEVFKSNRIGIRLSPFGTFNDIGDSDPIALFMATVQMLNQRDLAYIHMIEPRSTNACRNDQLDEVAPITSEIFRKAYSGKFISAGGYDRAMGEKVLKEDMADAIAYGRLYISNPDLAERFQTNAVVNSYDRSTFYGGDHAGYTDYPPL